MDWTAGEQSTKHRGKGGGSTFPELPDQLRGRLPFVENLHPRFGRLADSSRSPKCSRSALSLIGRSRSINHSQSITFGGRGAKEGEVVRGGSESLGVLGSGLDGTGLARRAAAAGAGTDTGTGRCARVGQEPCPSMRHPSTLHPAPRSLGNLSCSSHHISQTTLGTPC